jgi:cell fate regulator YaaT (PSP1 superfamily)
MSAGNPYAVPPVFGRPGRRLFVVTFKCSRADIFYLYDNTGLEIRCGDLVIVEGDRGGDLGQVTHADVSLEEARKQKIQANEEHFRWLVMFSQYSLAGTSNDTGMLGSLARANGYPNAMSHPSVTGPHDPDTKPKMIKRLAQQHEIMGLRDKEGQEAKAKRLGAQKAADHKLPMEILDAEYQA